MNIAIALCVTFLAAAMMAPAVHADSLSDAFRKAQDLVRDSKSSSSQERNRSRDERAERGTQQTQSGNTGPSQREIEQQRREQEKQRIQKNVDTLTAELATAATVPRKVVPPENAPDPAAISARQRQVDALVDAGNAAAALKLTAQIKDKALQDSNAVRDAIAKGQKPPFRQLWDFYKYNRPVGLGLVPEENRCAIQLSMTLGLEPKAGEASLASMGNKALTKSLEGPLKTMLVARVKDTQIASRYYISAQQLANRLVNEFGPPRYLDGKQARAAIAGRRGIVFLQNAYLRPRGRTGDHIDLWDRDRIAATATSTPFERAGKVLFWELQ